MACGWVRAWSPPGTIDAKALTLEDSELRAWLRLGLTSGVGPATGRVLLRQFGLVEDIFQASESALLRCVTAAQARALRSEPPDLQTLLSTTLDWLGASPLERRVVALGEVDYPQALLNIEDPPILLYALGQAHNLAASFAHCTDAGVAIVGSRNPTPQGVQNGRQFAESLAQAGLTVVSGLALGIDGAAHEGALTGHAGPGWATVAVVGTGLDRVYPKGHFDLAHRIAQRGLLLSEYPLGTPPLAANFPRRNRLIAGLCKGTLVVEAALKSGSLITAQLAAEQGKDVFAIPGSIHSTQARGCHALIKQGASLVESAQDVLDAFALTGAPLAPAATDPASANGADTLAGLSGVESGLLLALGHDPMGLDALQARCGMDTATLQALLMGLEIGGWVARLPGGRFQRIFSG